MVVAFDTEDYERNHDHLAEVGLCTWEPKTMRSITGIDCHGQPARQMGYTKDVGPHGEKLLENMFFYHARVQENMHLINNKFCPGDPTACRNHSGQTRFLTVQETRRMLTDIFNWPIDPQRPDIGFCPVVILGHAIMENDESVLGKALGFSISQLPNYVRTLDNQDLTPEMTSWRPPFLHPSNRIGLRALVGEVIGFNYEEHDPHTACNDTVLTVVCVLQMALPDKYKVNQPKTLD
ncbi:hypothetical protein N0V86_008268 [Didymella sp. IMI 355093]|nr:hypothetical protein N0V86_008268 [Didymella sp. IMI 355093]